MKQVSFLTILLIILIFTFLPVHVTKSNDTSIALISLGTAVTYCGLISSYVLARHIRNNYRSSIDNFFDNDYYEQEKYRGIGITCCSLGMGLFLIISGMQNVDV